MVTARVKYVAILVLLSTGFAWGASEKQDTLERHKHRLMLEIEQTQARIGKMRVEAMEHEAMAKQLAAEAAALELQMHQEVERRKRDLELAGTEIKVDQMFAEVEQLERHGHHDEARALHAEAEGMAERLHAQRRAQEEQGLHQMELEIDELQKQSNQAEREGRIEEAKHLWRRADQLSEVFHDHLEEREQREHTEHMHARLGELEQAMEEARREGHEGVLNELREEAEDLKQEIHEHERHMEMRHMEQESHRLLEHAEEAEAQGRGDEADELREKLEQESHRLLEHAEEAEAQGRGDEADELRDMAEHVEHRLQMARKHHDEDEDEGDRKDWDDDGEDQDDDEDWDNDGEDESLHDELDDLREQIADMRELMEEILDRMN